MALGDNATLLRTFSTQIGKGAKLEFQVRTLDATSGNQAVSPLTISTPVFAGYRDMVQDSILQGAQMSFSGTNKTVSFNYSGASGHQVALMFVGS